MSADLDDQLPRFAESLDREAPAISVAEILGRGTVAVDVDLLEWPSRGQVQGVAATSWGDAATSHSANGEHDVSIEFVSTVAEPAAHRRLGLKVALAAAAAAVLVVALASIVQIRDETHPADVPPPTLPAPPPTMQVDREVSDEPETAVLFPPMDGTFVSPTYGYTFDYLDRGGLQTATEIWDAANQPPIQILNWDPRFDGVETGREAYFSAASTPIPDGVSIDEWVDTNVTSRSAGGCGVPRSEQAQISIDGQPGRKAECGHSEATVVAGGRLYLFIGPNDERRWFDAWTATIELTPETAVEIPALTSTFVSPTYGYTFDYLDRGGLQTATESWDPASGRIDSDDINDQFDTVETGFAAQFGAASTPIPEGVSIDEWVDEYVTPAGWVCGVPRSRQAEITIDGQSGRISECPDTADSSGAIQATVVAGERVYYFALWHMRHDDARVWFDAWIATIDLTPETAAVP